ncbi:hypothetical protein ABZ636_03875 [Streptomyces sp. NPDC007251]|uniref:hypothetical protein n=1 Tax=Streptomyces sp. NPDC007251 TaxID=3154483 RepID=UPI0033C6EF9A
MTIDPDAFRPLPIVDPKASAARAEAEALLAQANRMHADASSKAQRLVADARAEADRIRAAARAETEQRKKRDDNLDTWAARGIIAGAVGLTASGEYSLARMAGFDQSVAWLLPFVIDVYVIQAFRRHRDIGQAIALTVAANVTYHLAAVGLFGVTAKREPTWWLIALVASVASLILWRIHLMVRPPKPAKEQRRERLTEAAAGVVEPVERAHGERPKQEPEALIARTDERAHPPRSERPETRSPERPAKPKSERGERARKPSKKSAPASVTDRRRERVRALYDELGRRPEWSEIRDALTAAKLAEKTISRPTCQRIRDAVEAEEPKLAALGSDNVRALPGS